MENNENKKEVCTCEMSEGTLALCIDHDHITISVSRFEQLVKAEWTTSLIRHIYETADSYEVAKQLSLLFGPLPKKAEPTISF